MPAPQTTGSLFRFVHNAAALAVAGLVALCVSMSESAVAQPSPIRPTTGAVAAEPVRLEALAGAHSAGYIGTAAYGAHARQVADVYRPAGNPTNLPAIIWLHSGAWQSGDKSATYPALQTYVEQGRAVVVSINYRLAPQYPFPAALQDTKRAVEWVKTNAAVFGVNPNRVILAGGSAGANLATMAAVTPGQFEPAHDDFPAVDSSVSAVVNLVGPSDFTTFHQSGPYATALAATYLNCPVGGSGTMLLCSPDKLRTASINPYIDPTDPPAYIAMGGLDTLVRPSTDGRPLADAWSAARGGHGVIYDEIPDQGHNIDVTGRPAFVGFMNKALTGQFDPVKPVGLIEEFSGATRVRGYAADPNTTEPIAVRVTVGGTVAATSTAAQYRPDLTSRLGAMGVAHGYDITVANPTGATVCVVAINVGPGEDTPLGCVGAGYNPISPARLADSRVGFATIDGHQSGAGKMTPASTRSVTVTGRAGLPLTGVSAVVVNVTVADIDGGSFLTVYPHGAPRPLASNLNLDTGKSVANLVVAAVGTHGQIDVFNAAGTTHMIVDVVGWFGQNSDLHAASPQRLVDTRSGQATVDGRDAGGGALGANSTRTFTAAGRAGVPNIGAGAVILNVTATGVTAPSYLSVFPAGTARPNASNVNMVPGRTTPNLVVATLADGKFAVFNHAGSSHVIVDVVGWLPATVDTFGSSTPKRLADTRAGQATVDGKIAGTGRVAAGSIVTVPVAGRAGVPTNATSVLVNLTGSEADAGTYLLAYPSGTARPNASTVNFGPTESRANMAAVKLGPEGAIAVFNAAGSTHVIVDVVGWFSD